MKKLMLAGAIAVSAALCAAGAAEAATKCQTSFLLGTWISTDMDGTGDAYCVVQFKKNGWIVQSSCPDVDTLFSQGTLVGRFNVKKDCSVSGNFDIVPKKGKKQDFEFTGTMNPNKGLITGKVKAKGQAGVKYKFVQQW